jgi:hypothetical protein
MPKFHQAFAEIQYPPEAATSEIDTMMGIPDFFKFKISCLITSEAKPLPPGEFILSNRPLTSGSLAIFLIFLAKKSLAI